MKQECILVGRTPSTAVAVTGDVSRGRGRVCVLRDVSGGEGAGVCMSQGMFPGGRGPCVCVCPGGCV